MPKEKGFTTEILNDLNSRNVESLDEYHGGCKTLYNWRCKKCGNQWEAQWRLVVTLKSSYCHNCDKKETFNNISKKLEGRNIICLSSEYLGASVKLKWKCEICSNIWESAYRNVITYGYGCPKCGDYEKGTPVRRIIPTEEINNILKTENRKLECIGQYRENRYHYLNMKCLKCNNEYTTTFRIAIILKCGCQQCYWDSLKGSNHSRYKPVHQKYAREWNFKLKEFIRNRDDRKCQICGGKENNRHHAVHHIDSNKENCNTWNLITLCNSCHGRIENSGSEKYVNGFYEYTHSFEL